MVGVSPSLSDLAELADLLKQNMRLLSGKQKERLISLRGASSIDFRAHGLVDEQIPGLCRHLLKLDNLTKLYLECNNISNEGATTLGHALSSKTTLQVLSLRHNDISGKGAHKLLIGTLVKHVDLRDNKLTSVDVEKLLVYEFAYALDQEQNKERREYNPNKQHEGDKDFKFPKWLIDELLDRRMLREEAHKACKALTYDIKGWPANFDDVWNWLEVVPRFRKWEELTKESRHDAEHNGWSPINWRISPPLRMDMSTRWSELHESKRGALERLGWTERTWKTAQLNLTRTREIYMRS